MNYLSKTCRSRQMLFVILFYLLPVGFVSAQSVYDLNSIEADTTIIGSSYQSWIKNAVVLDIDNSGLEDLFVRDAAFQDFYGEVCVFGYLDFFSRHNSAIVDIAQKSYDIVIVGDISVNDKLGYSLATGDWNHDGIDDLALGDPTADHSQQIVGGTVDVFFGGAQWQPGTVIDLAQDATDIFIFSSDPASTNSWLGGALATIDINNDGIDDLAIGEKYGRNQAGDGAGAVRVVYGSTSFTDPVEIDVAQGQIDLTLAGRYGADWFGESLAVGDLNGDQVDDLVVGAGGAWHWDAGWLRLGAMYAFFGSSAFPPFHHIDLSETVADVTILGNYHNGSFGKFIACGDINGDGLSDMCGGQYAYSAEVSSIGAGYLFWGRQDFTSGTLIDLRTESADVRYLGDDIHQFALGIYVTIGDLSGDGKDELCLSSWTSADNAESVSGAHHSFIGSSEYPSHHVVELSNSSPSLRILGDDYLDAASVFSTFADINNDGFQDILIGHNGADRPEAEDCGEIYIFYSRGQPIDRPPRVLAGPGPEAVNPPELRLWDPFYNASGWSASFSPFLTQGFGLNPAAGDLDGDGYDEILVGPGPGPSHPPTVRVLDEAGGLLWQFQAYGTPRYGVNLAAGDLDGDGDEEIVSGAGPGAVYGPHVRGWNLGDGQIVPLGTVSFLAYGTRRWGVNVVCGDIDGDGYDEIITGAGPGDVFGPHVRGWDVDGGAASPMPGVSWLAYGTPRWGVNVACGDIDGDGIDEIVTGPGPSEQFGAHVRGWNCDGGSVASIPGVNFFAFQDTTHAMGCVVACGDLDNDHIDEILTVPGPHPDNPASLKSWNYDGEQLAQIERMSFLLFEEGEYVAGAKIGFGNFHQDPPFLP